ncbi:MAG: response regulator [Gammaproteobacteria bacterium]|nr:response regulator [Gammaproteobacteria bacterium]
MDNSQQKATILAVDDSRVMLVAAAKALKDEFEVLKAADGEEAWQLIQARPDISVVFSDLSMPNMDGYGLLDKIKNSENPQIAALPVVILTGQEDGDGTKERVMQAGATDFLIKPFDSLDLLSRARSLSHLSTQLSELSEKQSLDKLTQLYTEASYNDSGERALAYAQRHGSDLSLLRCDIENFSELFVKNGKQLAESMLIKLAELIKSVLRQEDIAGRLGVAKFSMLLIDTDQTGAEQVISRLRQAIEQAALITDGKLSINIACVSPAIEPGLSFSRLCLDAEKALEDTRLSETAQAVSTEIKVSPLESAGAVKKPARIDLTAVLREIIKNKGRRLTEKQLNASLATLLPLLAFLNEKLSLEIDETIARLSKKISE